MNNYPEYPGWSTVRLIGRGSFATVYEIERDIAGTVEKAALKVISIPQSQGEIDSLYSDGYDEESISATFDDHLENVLNEYKVMRAMCSCPNVVRCDDVYYEKQDNGVGYDIYIRMELLNPLINTLQDEIEDAVVIKLAKDMLNALSECKKNDIIHRDIKPQNIFVTDKGDYKLGDFGVAKIVERTTGGTKIGTYKYMAPEVYNNKPYGSGSDLYSLGLVLYWMLNEHRLPFLPLPPEKITNDAESKSRALRFGGEKIQPPVHGSEELKKIVLKACEYEPEDRFDSPESMLAALEALERNDLSMASDYAHSSDEYDEEDKTIGILPVQQQKKKKNAPVKPKPKTDNAAVTPEKQEEKKEDSGQKNKSYIWWIIGGVGVIAAIIAVLIFTHVICINHNYAEATCTAPKTCVYCGKTDGEPLGHDYTEADCTTPATCSRCEETTGEALGHVYTEANCTTPATCMRCGETDGEALGHMPTEADCINPGICMRCGEPIIEALGHVYTEANCTTPATCMRCGETTSEALGHVPSDADCTNPSICMRCGEPMSEALGHVPTEADCTNPSICMRCGEPMGEALGHAFTEATCTAPATCVRCGTADGWALGHVPTEADCTNPGICMRCGEPVIEALGHIANEADCTHPAVCWRCGAEVSGPLDHEWTLATVFAPASCTRCKITSGDKLSANVGDIITIGRYEQDNNPDNGKEPVEWLVLAKQRGKALVISRYAIECLPYHTEYAFLSWHNCNLRYWLNSIFLDETFTADEREHIEITTVKPDSNPEYNTDAGIPIDDYVFLFSIAEAEKYFSTNESRKCAATPYAVAQGVTAINRYTTSNGEITCQWWLRTPGIDQATAAIVSLDGAVYYNGDYVSRKDFAVRPAMWINIGK